MQDKFMDWTQACAIKADALSSHALCNHDLQGSNMALARHTLSCHDAHLCQIFWNPTMQDWTRLFKANDTIS